MRITTKSKKVPTTTATVSMTTEPRYCSCARTRARIRRPYRPSASSRSPTLDHQPSRAERDDSRRGDEHHDSPRELHEQRRQDVDAYDGADENVDGRLDHRWERR